MFDEPQHPFSYRVLSHDEINRSSNMRAHFRMLCAEIDRAIPDGKEKDQAMVRLAEAYWWVLEAIRRGDRTG